MPARLFDSGDVGTAPAVAAPFRLIRRPQPGRRAGRLIAAAMVVAMTACGKKEPTPPPAAPVPGPTAELPGAASPTAPAEAPPPDLGMPLDTYVAARVLEQCAIKHSEDTTRAETLAVGLLQGRKPAFDLDKAAAAEPVKKPPVPAAPEAGAVTSTVEPPDSPQDAEARLKYRQAHERIVGHAPTQARIAKEVETCLYAPELGLIAQELIDRYAKAFVEIACLQRQIVGPDGKPDPIAHAHAAGKVFTDNGFQAAEFSKVGLVLSRFPSVQARVHEAKAQRCPDPRIAAAQAAGTGRFSGMLTGDRGASLQLTAAEAKVDGAVQWVGPAAKFADGASEPTAFPVSGAVSGSTISLFGEQGYDWVRLEGKVTAEGMQGTWTAQRNLKQKLKGTWKAERVPDMPASATPTTP